MPVTCMRKAGLGFKHKVKRRKLDHINVPSDKLNMSENSNATIAQNVSSSTVSMLLAERERLLQEISRIDRFLAQEGVVPPAPPQAKGAQQELGRRPQNTMSKLEAIIKVLEAATKPLSQRELVNGIEHLGYVFASKNPYNTLNPYLYGEKRVPEIKKIAQGFILARREREFLSNDK